MINNSIQSIPISIDISIVPELVITSIVVSCLSSFAAIYLNNRRGQPSFVSDNIWLLLAAIVMSLGIWSMHFIGMSAIAIPGTMTLNYVQTLLSIVPPLIASYVAFYIVTRRRISSKGTWFASVLM